jgi:dipeptidyl aminopeptidase/acylaminoacyl peptidase
MHLSGDFRMFRCLAAALLAGLFFVATPAPAAPPVETYGKLPAVDLMTLSPSGDGLVYVGVNGDTRQLMIATRQGGIQAMAPTGITKVIGIRWAGEDHLLVTASTTTDIGAYFTTEEAELAVVIVLDLRSHKNFVVFGNRSDLAHMVEGQYGVAHVDGHWYGYFGGITYSSEVADHVVDHSYADLYRVDLDTGEIQLAAPGSPDVADWLVDPDGLVVARSLYRLESGHWQVLVGGSGAKVLASGTSDFGSVDLYRGRTPDAVLIDRPTSDGGMQLQELSLSGAPTVDIPEGKDTTQRFFDRNNHLWIGLAEDADVPEANMFAPAVEAKVRGVRKAFPGETVKLVSWSEDFQTMIVFTSGGDDSGAYWLVNISTGKAEPLGYAYPDVGPEDVGPIQMVDWKAQDGLALRGVLSLPPGRPAKNLPLVVMPHGGPEARDYPVFDWWAQVFASRGYAVFQPNFRGSSGYGTQFRNAGFGEWGRKMQTDISDGVAELARRGVIDPKRACVVGWSFGGYAALAGVTVQRGLYRCSVSMAGVSDPAALVSQSVDRTRSDNSAERYWKAFMGVNFRYQSELNPYSPLKLAARADAPILLLHGNDDTVVPIDQSRAMDRALREAGKPVDLVVLPNADHWLLHEDTRLTMATRSVAFVEKYNPPDPAAVQTSSASATKP